MKNGSKLTQMEQAKNTIKLRFTAREFPHDGHEIQMPPMSTDNTDA